MSTGRSLADLTTFGVGGPARHFIEANNQEELLDAVRAVDDSGEPLFVLSGGSNVLVGDAGFNGTVVRVAGEQVTASRAGDGAVLVEVSAGTPLDALVARSVAQGWAGLEALSGVPGLVGAAPVQNVGAYGAQIGDSLLDVRVWDRREHRVSMLSSADCGFGYRDSVLKRSRQADQATGRYVVLAVRLRLTVSMLSAPVAYADLADRLGVANGQRAPLQDVRAAVLEVRRSKGTVFDPADPDSRSAGSFFTNPFVDASAAARLPDEAPRHRQPDGTIKTSAAWLIQRAGFPKGFGEGPAQLSSKNTLVLTNRGGATAADIVALAKTIQAGVQRVFGVWLEPEPVLIGVKL